MVDLSQYNTSPIDVSGLTGISNQLNQSYDQYNQIFSKNMENLNTSRQQYLDLIKKLQEKEDNASTGNPFIDMLNGYKNFRKSRDPNYNWQGLVGAIANKLDKRKSNKLAQYQDAIDNPVLPYSPDRDKYAGQSTAPQQQSVPQPQWRPETPLMPQTGKIATLPQFDSSNEYSNPLLTSSSAITNPPHRTATNSFLDLIKSMPSYQPPPPPNMTPNMDLIQQMRLSLANAKPRRK